MGLEDTTNWDSAANNCFQLLFYWAFSLLKTDQMATKQTGRQTFPHCKHGLKSVSDVFELSVLRNTELKSWIWELSLIKN